MDSRRLLVASLFSIGLSLPCPTAAQTPPPTLNVTNTTNAAPGGPPVEVEDCKLAFNGKLLIAKTGKLTIEFTNEGNVAADLLRFRVTWGNDGVAFIRDQGSFAPGVTVKHLFRQSEGELISPLFSHPDIHCSLESVHFVDGTMWTNPSTAAPGNVAEGGVAVQIPQSAILGSGYIGISLTQSASGILVRLILPGSPAELGGLQQGDIIQTINGQRVHDVDELTELVTSSKPDSSLTIGITRGGAAATALITTIKRPASIQSTSIL